MGISKHQVERIHADPMIKNKEKDEIEPGRSRGRWHRQRRPMRRRTGYRWTEDGGRGGGT